MIKTSKYVVLGANGLIGSALCSTMGSASMPIVGLDWNNRKSFKNDLEHQINSIVKSKKEINFNFVWSAGKNNLFSTWQQIENEIKIFSDFLDIIKKIKIGSLTFISSAGALYSKAGQILATESSEIDYDSPYAQGKFMQEQMVEEFHRSSGSSVIVPRVTSVYGIRSSAEHQQGVIYKLIKGNLAKIPVKIFIPLDIKRNYVYSDVAAAKIWNLLKQSENSQSFIIKIIGSSESHSLNEVIAKLNRIMRKKTPYLLGENEFTENYANFFSKSMVHTNIDTSSFDTLDLNLFKLVNKTKQRLIQGVKN